MINIDIFLEGEIDLPYKTIDKESVHSLASEVSKYLKLDNISISFILTDNAVIHQVNKEYRDKDRPTDVISFAYRENAFPIENNLQAENGDSALEELGDIYLSMEKAEEQSIEYGVTLFQEVKRLIIHSILHLIGYDHETSREDEKIMQNMEDELFNNLPL